MIWDDDLECVGSATYGKDKEVLFVRYPTVHSDDIEPLSIIAPNKTKGPWIAGGACLRWYQSMPVGESDIDVFCSNARQAQELIDRLKTYGRYSVKHTSENATTLHYFPFKRESNVSGWVIQIITKRYYADMQEIIDNFDLSVCQIATAGEEWILGNYTACDVREKNLRMKLPLMPDAAKRLVKYWTYGYRPVDGLVDEIINNPEGNWKFNPTEDYS
jgi:hypothetical protein